MSRRGAHHDAARFRHQRADLILDRPLQIALHGTDALVNAEQDDALGGRPDGCSQHRHGRGHSGHLRDVESDGFGQPGVGDAGNFETRVPANPGNEAVSGSRDGPGNTEHRNEEHRRNRHYHKRHHGAARMPAPLAHVEHTHAIDDHRNSPASTSEPMRPSVSVITRSVDDAASRLCVTMTTERPS